MNININETVSQGLSLLTYNGDSIITPKDDQLNIFMGIGLWSVRDGLSEGLPIDVMQMLLSATLMRSQILKANPGKSSKIIVLIADSMAILVGANPKNVSEIVDIYKKSLNPLLHLLNINRSSEIILSSELENCSQYQEILESVGNSKIITQLKTTDETHYAYIRNQTAITHYMNTHRHVGIKVGWMCEDSSKQLKGRVSAQALKQWDELKFDTWSEEIYKSLLIQRVEENREGSTMQYVYVKPGLKQSVTGKKVNVSEGCPYTAYSKDRRYIVQTQDKRDIKTICPIQKRVATQWKGIAEVCLNLIQVGLVHDRLLPENCIKKSNVIATVYNMLNHWANPPTLSSNIVDDELASPQLSDFLSNYDPTIYRPTIEDSYRLPIMSEMAFVKSVDKPRTLPKWVLL